MVNLSMSRYSYLNGGDAIAPALHPPQLGALWTQQVKLFSSSVSLARDATLKLVDPFGTRNSATYEKIRCNQDECNYSTGLYCMEEDHFCNYVVAYGDGTYSTDYLAAETLTFIDQEFKAGKVSLSNMLFGCGAYNVDSLEGGCYYPPPGMVGLNNQKSSLISQLDFEGFSYCFTPSEADVDTPLYLGALARYDGARAPILSVGLPGRYYLDLQCISVGDQCLPLAPETFNATYVRRGDRMEWRGGFMIDSGITYTLLIPVVVQILKETVIQKTKCLRQMSETTRTFQLCYRATLAKIEQKTPSITFQFSQVASFVASGSNSWVPVGLGLACLAIIPTGTSSDVYILGNVQQQNINVDYNLKEGFVSFKSMDCTKL
ncbi:aspartic proteinase nepenthesin-1-like [Macadamia integrifolia]|uniref:aspartic proteinase nepenthesin-1-like n=1 Tax=Macadamia integrifolia TaxID=60698 RepID=UPI001C4ED593|nr:aspartic proteinase nepenthesin-1-like [Macadamia integrifolia]